MDIQIQKKKYLIPRRWWGWIGGGVALALLLTWLATSGVASTRRVDRRGLSIVKAERGEFNDYVNVDGSVVPFSVVQVSPEEGGTVVAKVVEEGAHVDSGDVLVRLSNSRLDLEILNAESELAEKQNMLRNTEISMAQDKLSNENDELQLRTDVQAKRRAFLRSEKLHQEQLISDEDYLQAKENYELARQKHALVRERIGNDARLRDAQVAQMSGDLAAMRRNVELVRERKERLNVRSKISGEVGLLDVELGQSIASGEKIGVINDLSDYKVEAHVDEHYIDRVHAGLSASFEQNGHTYVLRLRKVYPDVREGRFRVDFTFAGERPANIRTGQSYYVNLQLGQPQQAVFIPRGTFYSVTGGKWVFVLDKDGQKAYRRPVRIGRQNPQYYEVLEGLEPGEQVIVSGYESFEKSTTLKLK